MSEIELEAMTDRMAQEIDRLGKEVLAWKAECRRVEHILCIRTACLAKIKSLADKPVDPDMVMSLISVTAHNGIRFDCSE